MIKILMIDTGYNNYELNEPLGIEVLSEYLEQNLEGKIQIDVVASLLEPIDDFIHENYEFVCISANFDDNGMFERVVENFYYREDRPVIIVGGVRPTISYDNILGKYSDVICIIGEGEDSLLNLIQQFISSGKIGQEYLEKIPNLAYKVKENILMTFRKVIGLENICFYPKRKYINKIIKNGGLVRIEASRGCDWNKCSFCILDWKYAKEKRRCYPIKKVINEIEYLYQHGVKTVYFTDEEFVGYDKKRLLSLINGIKELIYSGRIDKTFSFFSSTSVKCLKSLENELEFFLNELKDIGCKGFFLGIESCSQSQLDRYCKGVTVEDNSFILRLLEKAEITADVGYILFDPLVTKEELIENIECILSSPLKDNVSRYIKKLRLIPHTKYYKNHKNDIQVFSFLEETIEYKYGFKYEQIQNVYEKINEFELGHIAKEYSLQAAKRKRIGNKDIETELVTNELKLLRESDIKYLAKLIETGGEK